MVVFVDLEDESEPPEDLRLRPHWDTIGHVGAVGYLGESNATGEREEEKSVQNEVQRVNPNKGPITEALGCYPVIISIASHIDLNTLDSLSLSCRQVRANLLQFRTQLLTATLHCENEDEELDPENTFRFRARAAYYYVVEMGRESASGTGKVGDCARDMVGGCRRCGRVICRNCTIKPPSTSILYHRHRRICKACSRVPLSSLVSPALTETTPTLKADSLKRSICTCVSDGVWLCQPCGRSLRSADSEYEGIWKWRTRYLLSLGGLGVGFGEGNRGVPCGRGGECVAAREVEQEIDCDAEDAREIDSNSRAASPSSSPGSAHGSISSMHGQQMGPGYARHEIEGIGGVVKKKLVRMVKVGACVPEWEDEMEKGKFLVRETDGRARSWCGWCWRVVPGVKDLIE